MVIYGLWENLLHSSRKLELPNTDHNWGCHCGVISHSYWGLFCPLVSMARVGVPFGSGINLGIYHAFPTRIDIQVHEQEQSTE